MSANVLSRVAWRIYWLGRYLERADATARLMAVNAHLLMDLPVRLPLGWRPLIDITGSAALFDRLYGPEAQASEHNVCRFLATDPRNPGSLLNSIANVRGNAHHVREARPRVSFEYINELAAFARGHLRRPIAQPPRRRPSTASAASPSSSKVSFAEHAARCAVETSCASATTSNAPT